MVDSDNPTPAPEGHPVMDIQALSQLDAKEVANRLDFQAWAGDNWRETGEIVTEDDDPVLFYHGGISGISEFSTEQTPNTAPDQQGIYFTNRLQDANFYAGKLKIDQIDRGLPKSASVYAVMLKMKNPYVTTNGDGVSSETIKAAPEGYDGIINTKSQEVVVFDPSQVFIAGEAKR